MPDNADYLLLGLAVVVGLVGLYVVLLALRFRAARRTRQRIEQFLDDPTQAEVSVTGTPRYVSGERRNAPWHTGQQK
jgi:hypothetical protein